IADGELRLSGDRGAELDLTRGSREPIHAALGKDAGAVRRSSARSAGAVDEAAAEVVDGSGNELRHLEAERGHGLHAAEGRDGLTANLGAAVAEGPVGEN